MFDINQFKEILHKNTQDLSNFLDELSEEQKTTQFSDRWNLLEELEHINLVEKQVMGLLVTIKSEPIEVDELFGAEKLSRFIINLRSRKVKSPEQFIPTGAYKSIDDFKTLITKQRNMLLLLIENKKIVLDNMTYVHPYLGEMTKTDWVNFIPLHAERHLMNMKDNF
jgi:DinB superfamily